MKNYQVLCNVEQVISFDEPITFNCVTLYYQSEKLIAETSIYAESVIGAEKEGINKISKVINALAIELGCNVDYSLRTIKEKENENVKNYANNDLITELTVRVPFNPEMHIKAKRNNKLADENNKVKKVLRLVNNPYFATWVTLYKVFEIIDRDQHIVNEGWLSSTKRRNFTRTANHPESSGDLSRHGVPKSEKEVPPSNPMQLDEAEKLIRTLVEKWLEKLAK